MSLSARVTAIILLATVVPSVLVGWVALSLMQAGATAAVDRGGDAVNAREKLSLAATAQDRAHSIEDYFDNYASALATLRRQVEITYAQEPAAESSGLSRLYAGRDTAGLPACGYVDARWGAFANWDRRGYDGSVWMRRAIVEKARDNAVFRRGVQRDLQVALTDVPAFRATYEQYKDACDLVWLVYADGYASTYPNDYRQRLAANPALNELDESREDYVKSFDPAHNPQRKPGWMVPYLDAIQHVWMASVVTPVYQGDRFVGTLGMDLTIASLNKLVSRRRIGQAGYAFMLSSTGHPLALPSQAIRDYAWSPEQRGALEHMANAEATDTWTPAEVAAAQQPMSNHPDPAMRQVLGEMLRSPQGTVTVNAPSGPQMVAYCRLRSLGWVVGVAMPTSELQASSAEARSAIALGAAQGLRVFPWSVIVLSLLAGAFGAWAGRRITQPIRQLSAAVDQLGRSDDWHEVPSAGRDELAILGDSINRMVGTIVSQRSRIVAILDGVHDAIFVHDEDGVIRQANQRACALYACTMEELLGHTVADISVETEPFSLERALSLIERARNGESQVFEWLCKRADGTPFWTEVNLSGAVLDGKPSVIAAVRDVEQRKLEEREHQQLVEELAQAQRLDSVGRLAGGVAHDFNNMLGVIIGHAELALSDVGADHPLRGALLDIHTAAERSAALTQQLLAFARKQAASPQVLDLNETIDGVLRMLRRLIGENVELVWSPASSLGLVRIDPSQVDQILTNLCINARDAIVDTGVVTIQTCNTYLDAAYCAQQPDLTPGEYVTISVSDTGQGMDAETAARVFEPFFSTKEVGKGTGLGLATVYGIARQNHGLVQVHSEPGRGSTFRLHLPRLAAEPPAPPSATPERHRLSGQETVLLVEDEHAILSMVRMMLERNGYRVLATSTPDEALRVAQSHEGPIHLLLTDVVMPNMNGRDLASAVLAHRRDIACLFMSGYTAGLIAHHGVLDDGVPFIEKPFGMEALATKVRSVLDARQ